MSRRVLIVDGGTSLGVLIASALMERGIDADRVDKAREVLRPSVLEIKSLRDPDVPCFYCAPDFHNDKPYGKNARRALRGGKHD